MYTILKVASAVVTLICAIHAAPLSRPCLGQECFQSASSGSVNIGSTTNIVPVTQVTPITRYQPIIQSYAPIVESETSCEPFLEMSMFKPPWYRPMHYMSPNYKSYLGSASDMTNFGDNRFRYNVDRFNCLSHLRFLHRLETSRSSPAIINKSDIISHFEKRVDTATAAQDEQGQAEKHRPIDPECIPSATVSCKESLPVSTTDMGSMVTAMPKDIVLPSTIYQGQVQDKVAQVYAAQAQHTTLSHSSVNLGSNTFIQPVTKVISNTIYQPSVDQKATLVEAAPSQDLSLTRSSVELGSTVTIRPVTTVEPLTIYQPKVESLPFIIHDETGCVVENIPPAHEEEGVKCTSC